MIYKKYTVKKLIALCLSLTLTAGFIGAGGTDSVFRGAADRQPDAYESELDSLKAQQKALDKKIEEAQAEIDKQKDDLEALKEKYTAVKAKIDNVEEQLAKNEDAMVDIDTKLRESRAALDEKNAEIEELRTKFLARLKTMYIAGGENTYENVLVNSADFFDVLMRVELVKRVAEHDNEALDELMTKKREIEAVQAEIEESSEKLKEQTLQYSTMRDELRAEKESLSKIIEESDGKLDTLALDKAAMELRASQLTDEYDSAYSKAHTTTTAPEVKGTPSDENGESAAKQPAGTSAAQKEAKTATTTVKAEESAKTSTTTKKAEESTKTTTTTAEKTEETKKTTTTVTEKQTEPPAETEPPVTETEPPVTETDPPETEPDVEPEPQPEPEPAPYDDSRQSKIDTVMDYARSNVGGAYVWGGASYRATDCSGLVMLSYSQIGINMPHLASMQADYGTPVNYDELQEGDLVFFSDGGISDIYHVAIYNGNGRIVHAANSDDGIIFSDLASFSMYNRIICMRRII